MPNNENMNRKKSIIFMGTPEFAVNALSELSKNSDFEIKAVVTGADKQRGRGKKVSFTPVKEEALRLGIPVLQPIKMRDKEFLTDLKCYDADLFVIVAFRILPKKIIESAKIGAINLHASLLPKYRGAAPINYALFKGEKESGLSIFFLNNLGVDTGSLVDNKIIQIEENDNFGSLYEKLKIEGSTFLSKTVSNIISGNYKTSVQKELSMEETEKYKATKLFYDDYIIDWNLPAEIIHNKVRGLSPKPGAITFLNDKIVKIIKTAFDTTAIEVEKKQNIGKIIEINAKKKIISVQTGLGILNILFLKPEGKKEMDSGSYINGGKVKLEDSFKSNK